MVHAHISSVHTSPLRGAGTREVHVHRSPLEVILVACVASSGAGGHAQKLLTSASQSIDAAGCTGAALGAAISSIL